MNANANSAGTELKSREHYELMEQFEREFKGYRLDKEAKEHWLRGAVYQNSETNELFKAYRHGYALAKALLLSSANR